MAKEWLYIFPAILTLYIIYATIRIMTRKKTPEDWWDLSPLYYSVILPICIAIVISSCICSAYVVKT